MRMMPKKNHVNDGDLRFRSLIEHSQAGITLINKDLDIIYRSPSAARITGWSEEQRAKVKATSLVHPDDEHSFQDALMRAYAQPGEPLSIKFRSLHFSGHYIWLDCTLTNLLHEPNVEAIVFNYVDITHQMEREAKQEQRIPLEKGSGKQGLQVEVLLDSISDGFIAADAEQRYVYVNRRLCEMVGKTPEELIGRKMWDVFPDAVGSDTYLAIQKALREKRHIRNEDHYAPLGLWQENRIYPNAEGFAMFVQDITHRKKADEQLAMLVDRAPDMIGILGSDRHFKRVNPAMCRQLEYTEEQLLNTSLDKLVHPEDLDISRDRTKAFMATGDQTIYFENRFLTKTGKAIWLSWTVSRSAEEGLMFCVGKNITEKKEMENLLQKVNQLARIGGWEVDFISGKAYWSPITREIYDVPESFIPSAENWLSFYREGADRKYISAKMAGTILTGEPCDAEVEMITAKGEVRWVRALADAEFKDGICIRVYGSFQDIDDRKKAELAALAALAERNEILESIGDAFFALDKNWIVTYWNAVAEELMGSAREEMLSKYFWDIFEDAVELDFYKYYHLAMETGTAQHFEAHYPPVDIWFEVHAYPSENGLSVFFRDITVAKKSAQVLKESEKRYSDLFQLSPQAMFVYDMKTLRFLDVNGAAISHYGYSKEEFLSMTILDIHPDEDLPKVHKAMHEQQENDNVKLHGIFRHRKKDGEMIHVDIQSNRMTYKGAEAKVVLANDVTERVRYIEAMEAQNKKLLDISWMQSHVIRAPLSRIMGLMPMLSECGDDNPDQHKIYEYIVASANELDRVIRSITEAAGNS